VDARQRASVIKVLSNPLTLNTVRTERDAVHCCLTMDQVCQMLCRAAPAASQRKPPGEHRTVGVALCLETAMAGSHPALERVMCRGMRVTR